MRGQFATPGLMALLHAAVFLYVLCNHPLRRGYYVTLALSLAGVCALVLYAVFDGTPWILDAACSCALGALIASAAEDARALSRAFRESRSREGIRKKRGRRQ